jgi:hypothetical protein
LAGGAAAAVAAVTALAADAGRASGYGLLVQEYEFFGFIGFRQAFKDISCAMS